MLMSELDLRFTSLSFAGTWGKLQGTTVERAVDNDTVFGGRKIGEKTNAR